MMKKLVIIFYFGCIVLLCTTITSCYYLHTKVNHVNKENIRESKKFVIKSPTKAHLIDGSLIVFEKGLEIENNTLKGDGIRYDLLRQNQYAFSEVTIDSVAYLKCYKKRLEPLPSLMSNFLVVFGLAYVVFPQHEETINQ